MKNKSFSGKYILYVIIFMVTAIVTFISMHYKTESAASVLMSEATLPVVMAKTEAGTLIMQCMDIHVKLIIQGFQRILHCSRQIKSLLLQLIHMVKVYPQYHTKSEIQEICRLSRVRKLKT